MSGEALYERYKDALRRGHVASLRGRLEEALTAYAEAAAIAPERATPHTSAGTALMRRKRPADAVRHYTAAVRLAPRDEAALLGRAQALTALDRRAQAADAYDAVAEVQAANGKLVGRRRLGAPRARDGRGPGTPADAGAADRAPACVRAGGARPGGAREGHGGARGAGDRAPKGGGARCGEARRAGEAAGPPRRSRHRPRPRRRRPPPTRFPASRPRPRSRTPLPASPRSRTPSRGRRPTRWRQRARAAAVVGPASEAVEWPSQDSGVAAETRPEVPADASSSSRHRPTRPSCRRPQPDEPLEAPPTRRMSRRVRRARGTGRRARCARRARGAAAADVSTRPRSRPVAGPRRGRARALGGADPRTPDPRRRAR